MVRIHREPPMEGPPARGSGLYPLRRQISAARQVRLLYPLPFSFGCREISLNHPQNRRNCPYFVKISLKVQAEKTVLSNNKAFYRAFSPEPGERSDFANSVDEFMAITNRRLCEPVLTSLYSR